MTRAALCWVTQSCLTLCDPMDYSMPGSSVHGDSPKEEYCTCPMLFSTPPVGFPSSSVVNNLPANTGDMGNPGSIPGWARYPEEGMATHSSILAWWVPGIEEPGGLQSMAWWRVGHNWARTFQLCHNSNPCWNISNFFKVCLFLKVPIKIDVFIEKNIQFKASSCLINNSNTYIFKKYLSVK